MSATSWWNSPPAREVALALRTRVGPHSCPACGHDTGTFRTQAQVGQAIGISQPSVSNYERGQYDMGRAEHARLISLYGITEAEFRRLVSVVARGGSAWEAVGRWRDRVRIRSEIRERGGALHLGKWRWGRLIRSRRGWVWGGQ